MTPHSLLPWPADGYFYVHGVSAGMLTFYHNKLIHRQVSTREQPRSGASTQPSLSSPAPLTPAAAVLVPTALQPCDVPHRG